MKKKIILGLLLVFMPKCVNAFTGEIEIKCNKTTLKPNESTECEIIGKTVESISDVEFTVSTGESLILSSITKSSNFTGTVESESGNVQLHIDEAVNGTFSIAKVTIKADNISEGNDSEIKIENASFIDSESSQKNEIEVQPLSIRIVSTINTLQDIKIDSKIIDGFSRTTNTYNLEISDKSKITITITPDDLKSEIRGDVGVKTLKYGLNTFRIVVTSEAGTANIYTLNINRLEIRTLKSLSVNNKNIGLISGTYNYKIEVDNGITSANIAAELNSANASFVDNYGPREVKNLSVGNNEILIKVKDFDGSALTYTINVVRLSPNGEALTTTTKAPTTTTTTTTTQKATNNVENPKTGPLKITGILVLLIISVISYLKIKKVSIFKLNK